MILGKEISEESAVNISRIESQLNKQVIYGFTDRQKTLSYGQCDAWQPDAYYVYCRQDLLNVTRKKQINIPFETNILHELSHLCQIEAGYPCTGTRNTPQTQTNPELFEAAGSLFSSSILDLDVDYRLKQMGYTSSYFYEQRLIRADKIARHGYVCGSIEDFVRMAVQLMCLAICYPNKSIDNLLLLYSQKNPELIANVRALVSNICEIGYGDPDGSFRCLVFLFSAFNLWSTHEIYFHEKAYDSLESVKADYHDIRTMERSH